LPPIDPILEGLSIPIPDPYPKTGINFYQHILIPGEFVVTMQQTA